MGQSHSGSHQNTDISQSDKLPQKPVGEVKNAYESGKFIDEATNKRKFIRFGTIRRKLARTLRTSKASDYRRHIRDLLQTWTIKEIESFLKEYESLEALKEIKQNSDKARQPPSYISKDFENLFKTKDCSDVILLYGSMKYYGHKSFLSCRVNYFKELFRKCEDTKGPIRLNNEVNVNSHIFDSLLKYIYTGGTNNTELIKVIPKLASTFGHLNELKEDLSKLHRGNEYSDVLLIFHNVVNVVDDGSIENLFEIPCHSSVLCARSSYFRSHLKKKMNNENCTYPIRFVLSENIIPRTYIKIILHFMYSDILDLSSVIKWKVADDGTGEADRLLTLTELAMELYEIAHFLDFPLLMQECENVVVDNLNASTLLGVFEWSYQPHGSSYVHRMAVNFFDEEFCSLCKTQVFLANLPKRFLLEAVKSDFLQANEEFVLATIIKWGEWQIAKTNEKPGTSPVNSLPRRSPKRKDIDNKTLMELIADLLCMVRVKHILPPSSSVLQSAYQRGLLQRPYPFDVVANEKELPSIVYWIREFNRPEYVRPRLFLHYYYESKHILHERVNIENDSGSVNGTVTNCYSRTYSNCMPDMLPLCRDKITSKSLQSDELNKQYNGSVLKIVNLDNDTLRKVILREKELKTSEPAVQALSLTPDNGEISERIQLQVVREFGLPDEVAWEIFQQRPDLIEDSSSASSKHSTLTKVGYLLRDDSPKRVRSNESNTLVEPETTITDCSDYEPMDLVSSTTNSGVLLRGSLGDFKKLYMATNISPSKVIDDSPLDLSISTSSPSSTIEQDLLVGMNYNTVCDDT